MTPPGLQRKEEEYQIGLHRARGAQRGWRERTAATQKPESHEGDRQVPLCDLRRSFVAVSHQPPCLQFLSNMDS